MPYKTLTSFEALFSGVFFNHRVHTNGDKVSINVFEDALATQASPKLTTRVAADHVVANAANRNAGINARRPDGTFGMRVQHVPAITIPGFAIKRGQTVSAQIGVEVKILSKAMSRQVGRVISDLRDGASEIRASNAQAITLAIVGINHAPYYVSMEGETEWRTTGSGRYKHPYQEAGRMEPMIRAALGQTFDEMLFLHFSATNDSPYPFAWVNSGQTNLLCGAIIGRIVQMYEQRT